MFSEEDLAIIAHVVETESPEEWALRVFNYPKGGEAAVRAKIARHREDYLMAKDAPGYKSAAERADQRRAGQRAVDAKIEADFAARKEREEAAFNSMVAEEVARQLAEIRS